MPAGLLVGAEGCFSPSPGTQLLLLPLGEFSKTWRAFFFSTKSQGQGHGHTILGGRAGKAHGSRFICI